VFHGCGASAKPFTENFGYNEFAATNDIIMVYPDSKCWGYNNTLEDDKAFTKAGMMPTAIMNMVTRVTTDNPDDEAAELAELIAAAFAEFL